MDKSQFTILVVDDEEGMREGIQKTLDLEGFSVQSAATGREALERLKNGGFAMAFIDLKLPDIDGVEVVRNMQPSSTVVVIMTAYATVETAVSAMKIGVADYIKKPFDNSDLIAIAERFYRAREMSASAGGARQLPRDRVDVIRSAVTLRSEQMKKALDKVDRIKDADIQVLLLGESGTGKEVFARLIYQQGNRRGKPFVAINCSAIPPDLLESELFGHERGAFSGAVALKKGKFEVAADGILFLDEIGDMEHRLQSKLLRVLEEKSFERIGGTQQIPFTARVLASTNRDIKQLIAEGTFRQDLYYRLNGVQIALPPLRERAEDIECLVDYYLNYYCEMYEKRNISLSAEAMRSLRSHDWPGNVRELKNVIESAILLATDGTVLLPENFRMESVHREGSSFIQDIEQESIIEALERNKFNRTRAARALQISRKTLYNKMKKFDL